MKTLLDEMLFEEYERSLRSLKSKKAALNNLPKGNLREKKIGNNVYYYLQRREEKRVKNQYVKKENLEKIRADISYRNEVLDSIKNINHDIKNLKRVLRINE